MAMEALRIVERLRKITEKVDEEEEILQTKIVSVKEVAAEWEKWIPSAQNEIDSLIIEKAALRPLEDWCSQRSQEKEKERSAGLFAETLKRSHPMKRAPTPQAQMPRPSASCAGLQLSINGKVT